ncbi:MAG TPA: AAA family ATPase [Gaiellaceae bacterium]|nr:AAA family ATPase [Gaiellaceae bacterium]
MERKLATVVFVDLVDSTSLVADADPEVVRRRVSRFFDSVSHCIVTHGGIVEKFAGDAVMAAFGIPLAHEDDAERAVRAAVATLDRVRELGLEVRIGIESGEVVADDSDSTFATGEPVNLAARLQTHAAANEILVGPQTARLLRDRVELEPLDPLSVRGWREPVAASRVVCLAERGTETAVGGLTAPLVGRAAELDLLENTFERTARSGRASLVTIYGDPGVGKSRLAREFVAGLEGATVLIGRCLPYGEGVTYWPLAEMVKASSGISDDDPLDHAQQKLRDYCEDDAVADLLGLAVGVLEAVEGERSQQEIAWAARAWAEQLAEAQPLVLLFEDVHWGEEPLLELIEHLAASVREAPLLLICLARPELLDVRPTWGGGRVRATTLELEPLPDEESAELVEALAASLDSPIDLETVLAKTEGNPLFVEETVRMLAEGARSGRIPDTLQALIAARIDRLPSPQRIALQRASVMGRIFMAGALAHLSPEIDDPAHCLEELLLRDLVVREPRATITGEEAYKFKHVLIREVAYSGLSKSSRAELHERYAEWLGERTGDELLEIRAFHLDQATTLLAELDGSAPEALRETAAAALTKAGRRALSREAFRSARKLLLRAVELAPTLERRYFAARAAWRLTDYPAVLVEMGEVATEAAQQGDRHVQGRALAALAEATLQHRADAVTARHLAREATEVLADAEPGVRFEPLWVAAGVASWFGDYSEFEHFAKAALEAAQAAERKDLEAVVLHGLVTAYVLKLDLMAASPLLLRALELADASGSLFSKASALSVRGWLNLVSECAVEAEADYAAARELYAELGNTTRDAVMTMMVGRAAFAQGDMERAEKLLRDATRALKGIGDRGSLCEAQRALAMVLVEKGNVDEAERFALEARENVGADDRLSQSTTRLALGLVRAAQRRDDEAESLLHEAVDGFAQYEIRALEHWALRYFAQFLRSRGRDAEAAVYMERRAALAPVSAAEIV